MRKSYAIKITNRLYPPSYLPGFETRQDAERHFRGLIQEAGCSYSVVYVNEYLNGAIDCKGNYPVSLIAEIIEPDK